MERHAQTVAADTQLNIERQRLHHFLLPSKPVERKTRDGIKQQEQRDRDNVGLCNWFTGIFNRRRIRHNEFLTGSQNKFLTTQRVFLLQE